MIRLSTLSGYALAVCAATALFWTSQTVQKAEDQLERVRHDLAREEESLHVLRAEWDYLNRPERIETLARKYLDMQPAAERTLIARANEIPPPAMAEAQTSAPSADAQVAADRNDESGRPALVATLASITEGSGGRR